MQDRTRTDGTTVTAPSGVNFNELTPELQEIIRQRYMEQKRTEWVAWAETVFNDCKTGRQMFERQWFLNLAFYEGKQYIAPALVPGYGFRLTTPRAPRHRVRLVINKIRKAVLTECARLCSSRPIPTVVPATNEREDAQAALIGEQILKAAFSTSGFEQEYRMAVWWAAVTGTGFIKQYWDAGAKDFDSMKLPETPMMPDGSGPVPDEIIDRVPGLRQKLNTPVPSQGKICIEKVSPFYIYVPDLMNTDINQQPYVIHVLTKTKQWVKNVYGFTPVADANSAATTLDTAMIIARGAEQRFDSVMVKEVWIKPGGHPDFPNGGLLTIINNRLVQCRENWPLPFPDYPFYHITGIPTGGFYGDSIVVDLIPLQKEYNKTRSKATEIKNIQGVARIVYAEGSVNPRKISTEPGQSIPYTPGYDKPDILPAVEVPASYNNEIERLNQEFDDLSNQHDLTQNGDPASGTAMAFLVEQDNELLVFQTSSIERATQQLGNHYLKLASNYWDGDRVVRVTGKNQTYEALRWKKDSLRGNTDVRVQTGSALPVSKAARQALITEFMQNGFIAPEAGLEVLDLGNLEQMMDEYLTDKRQAIRENLKIAEMPEKLLAMFMSPQPDPQTGNPPFEGEPNPVTGKPQQMNGDGTPFEPQPPIPVNSYDNHEAHIQWHNQYRKTEEFEILSDAHKKAFELHVQLHQLAIQTNQVNMGGQIIQQNGGQPGDTGGGDPSLMGPQGGGPAGASDPSFSEDPANMDAATSRARAEDARTQTGMFKN